MRKLSLFVAMIFFAACDDCGAPAPLVPTSDAGIPLPVVDAGFPGNDAGDNEEDAGQPEEDAGVADAGQPVEDGGPEAFFRIPSGSGESSSPRYRARVRVGPAPVGPERTP